MNIQQSSLPEVSPQQITTIISSLIAFISAVVTSHVAIKQRRKDKESQVELSDREQNRELVKNLQEADKHKQSKLDEMECKIVELYESCQSLFKENSEFRAKLTNYESQKDAWQRERDAWQSERELWQTERREHEQEKKIWEKDRQAWHIERRELVAQIRNLESQIQELELKVNRRYDAQS
jgi:chromosome segregation ATPase